MGHRLGRCHRREQNRAPNSKARSSPPAFALRSACIGPRVAVSLTHLPQLIELCLSGRPRYAILCGLCRIVIVGLKWMESETAARKSDFIAHRLIGCVHKVPFFCVSAARSGASGVRLLQLQRISGFDNVLREEVFQIADLVRTDTAQFGVSDLAAHDASGAWSQA